MEGQNDVKKARESLEYSREKMDVARANYDLERRIYIAMDNHYRALVGAPLREDD